MVMQRCPITGSLDPSHIGASLKVVLKLFLEIDSFHILFLIVRGVHFAFLAPLLVGELLNVQQIIMMPFLNGFDLI